MQTAAANITHEQRMVWNNNQNILDVSHATARIFRSGGYKETKDLKLKNTKRGAGNYGN